MRLEPDPVALMLTTTPPDDMDDARIFCRSVAATLFFCLIQGGYLMGRA